MKKGICVGCGTTGEQERERMGKDYRVERDPTFVAASGEFVCMNCYCELIPHGMDVGSAEELVRNMKTIKSIREEQKNGN